MKLIGLAGVALVLIGAAVVWRWRGMKLRRPMPLDLRLNVRIVLESLGTVGSLITATPVLLFLIGAAVAWLRDHDVLAAVLASASAGLLLAVVVSVTFLRASFRKLARGFRWKSAEYVYKIDKDDYRHHSQTVKINLVAVTPWVRIIENRYRWTGAGDEAHPQLVRGGSHLFGPVKLKGRDEWRYYYVHLGRFLDVGEERLIEVKQDLYDESDSFDKHLAKTVLEPIEHLTLRVLLPDELFPDEIVAYVGYPHPNEDREKLSYTADRNTGEIRVDVDRPAYGKRYVIEW